MFLDFNDIIKNNKITEKRIPAVVIEQMSDELPGNLFYQSDDNGFAFISGFEKVSNLKYDIPDELQAEVGNKEVSLEDILLYSYNSQENIKLKPAIEGFVELDNELVPVDRFIKSLNVNSKIENGSFCIIPKPFEEKGTLTISNSEYERDMLYERVPNKSIYYAKYKAFSLGFYITILIPFSSSDKAKFEISYSIDELSSYKEAVECISLYNSFVKGEGKINNDIIKPYSITNKSNYDELLSFFKKVESIENFLGCKFDLYVGDISYGLARDIEGLYQNLIKRNPVKSYNKIESITFDEKPRNEEPIDERYVFLYKTNVKKDILGVSVELPTIVCIFNITYKCSELKDSWKADVIYNEESYSSYLSFRNIDELNEFTNSYENMVMKMKECVDINSLI